MEPNAVSTRKGKANAPLHTGPRHEKSRETPHPKLRIARSRPVPETFLDELTQWLSQPGPVSDDEVRVGLKRWVPEYEPAKH